MPPVFSSLRREPFFEKKDACKKAKWHSHKGRHDSESPRVAHSLHSEPPVWGRQKGVTPICSDLFRFLPICSDLHSLFSGIPRFVPICSVFFRLVPICFQNKSEQIRETPFCRPLLQIPDESYRDLLRIVFLVRPGPLRMS